MGEHGHLELNGMLRINTVAHLSYRFNKAAHYKLQSKIDKELYETVVNATGHQIHRGIREVLEEFYHNE